MTSRWPRVHGGRSANPPPRLGRPCWPAGTGSENVLRRTVYKRKPWRQPRRVGGNASGTLCSGQNEPQPPGVSGVWLGLHGAGGGICVPGHTRSEALTLDGAGKSWGNWASEDCEPLGRGSVWGPPGAMGGGTRALVPALMLGAGLEEAYPWCWDGLIPGRTWLQADPRPLPGEAQTPSPVALCLSFLICFGGHLVMKCPPTTATGPEQVELVPPRHRAPQQPPPTCLGGRPGHCRRVSSPSLLLPGQGKVGERKSTRAQAAIDHRQPCQAIQGLQDGSPPREVRIPNRGC